MGFEAMRHDINTYYAGNNGKYGTLDYSGQYTGGPNPASPVSSGLSEADFYLGLPNTVELGINAGTWGQRSWVFAPYVQDDWRVTDRLTLNLGLRWEYNQPWYEAFNRQANFGPFSGTEYIAGQAGCPYRSCRALYNSYNRDFEPRIGFAYTPSFLGKNSVVRGAYTISSFLEGTGTNLRLPLNPPFQTEFTNLYDSISAPYTQYFPGSTTDQGLAVLTAPTNPLAGAQIRLWDPNVRPDTVQQWNFSIEHQFAGDMLLFLGYVGQHGTHLMIPMPYFQGRLPGEAGCPSTSTTVCGSPYLAGNPAVYDEISQISGTASIANQAYDALQAGLTKHLSRGLEFQLSYTYQKGMSNNIGYYGQGG
jgi:outer membrane receptor protein involved in Fe transport